MAKKKKNKNVMTKNKNKNSKFIFFSIVGGFILAMVLLFLIEKVPPVKESVEFDLAAQPILGEENAPVQLVEFGDFKCPACKSFEELIFPKIKQDYIDTGKAQFSFINKAFIGPDSIYAAVVGEAVHKQNPAAFWDYYNAVYENQGPENEQWASMNFLLKLVKTEVPSVDLKEVEQFINNGNFEAELEKDEAIGIKAGVQSTPTLFVNGIEVTDPFNYEEIKKLIDEALENAGE
jgi:protein-disulfide isomerase